MITNENKIRCSKFNLINLLKQIDLFGEMNYSIPENSFDNNKFSKEFLSVTQKGTNKEIYDCAMENKDYDFRLKDNSIMQFTIEKDTRRNIMKLRYAYYKCPYLIFGNNEAESTDVFMENYVSIRYDYDLNEYKETIHPISHFHIGNDNNLRIPINKVVEPLEFGIFIIRNIYVKEWNKLVNDMNLKDICLKSKEKLEEIGEEFFTNTERKFLYLG